MKHTKIGVLGSGQVAQVLGNGFLKHGYEVMLGSGNPSKLDEWKSKAGSKAKTGSFSDAAKFGTLLVLAVKGKAAEEVVKLAGIENLEGKIILDATNPIADAPPQNGLIKFFTTLEDSLMERLQRTAPKARFVKAFNSVGNAVMVNPTYPGGKPTMFICGNDDSAKKEATEILIEFGYEAADMGKAESARVIEPLCILWCIPGFLRNEWTHAFKLMKM